MIHWILDHHYAHHPKQAEAIYNLLELEGVRFWECVKRVILYRRWRNAGESPHMAARNARNGLIIKDMFQ